MHGPATFSKAGTSLAEVKISDRDLSTRQKQVLEGVFGFFSDEFARSLEQMLNELEQQLFRNAEQARSNEVQRVLLETQRHIRERRAQLAPRFLARVETALACVSDPPPPKVSEAARPQFSELSLVDTSAMDEAVALKEIGTRTEIRNSLSLFLLGQRFGVIAGRPAFDAETLPVGPHRLCRILRESVDTFDLDAERRALVYRQFDRSVMQFLGPFYEAVNNYLIGEGILPHLTYVPPRGKTPPRRRDAPAAPSATGPAGAMPAPGEATTPTRIPGGAIPARGGGWSGAAPSGRAPSPVGNASPAEAPMPGASPQPAGVSRAGAGGAMSPAGHFPSPGMAAPRASSQTMAPARASGAGLPGAAPPSASSSSAPSVVPWSGFGGEPDDGGQDVELFDTLRRLLSGRRSLIDKLKTGLAGQGPAATPQQVQGGLDQVQREVASRVASGQFPAFADIRRELLEQMRHAAPEGQAPQLSGEQGDTLDLVGMLFDQIGQEVRPQSPGGQLLSQLQVPLLRVALQDESFFTDRSNPARQMLNAIAEAGAYWSSADEADAELMQKMGAMVSRVANEYDGDPSLFGDLMSDLTAHLSTQQRKAEVSERRHVEAARGREKLEISRLQAEEAIGSLLAGQAVPKFLRALLEQVWTDVVALALLRGGESSPAFAQHMALARRLVEAAVQRTRDGTVIIAPPEAAEMRRDIETALGQIGQGAEEAGEVANRMLSAAVGGEEEDGGDADAASRTELAMKLRTRARLGQDVQTPKETTRRIEKAAPLTPEEKDWHERLKRLPFGTWFDFVVNQQGDTARRRMSWYSTVTDHCLFVNHRGQRAGDYTLSWLARELCRGNVRPIEPERASIVDRAWGAIVKALRSFAGQGTGATPSVAG